MFLKSHWSSNEQLVCGPTSKPNLSQANERVGPLVQDLELVLKGTTFLLSLKVGRSEFHLAPYVPIYSPSLTPEMGGLLSRRTRATLTHANLRIIPNKLKFMVSLGLRLSYLGHQMKKSVSTVNDIIKWEWFSSWSDLMHYSLHRTPPPTCLRMYNLVITLFISYTKVGRIHSVPGIRYSALSLYYRSFWFPYTIDHFDYILELDPLLCCTYSSSNHTIVRVFLFYWI